jgi:hypothetical protein
VIGEGATDMRQTKLELKRLGGPVSLVLLIGSLLVIVSGAGPVAAQEAGPLRTLPASAVTPGDEFEVTVTFTSPADGFSTIGLTESAPAGWNVSVDKDWCTPPADLSNPLDPWSTNLAEYIWTGLLAQYMAGDEFTAVYRVRAPDDGTSGSYRFQGTLEYYIGADGPYDEGIGGDAGVVVEAPTPPDGDGNGDGNGQPVSTVRALAPWIALGTAVIAGVVVFVVRRRA